MKKVGSDDQVLWRNPPDVGVTSRQKPCTKIIYIVLQTSVGLFQLSSQNNSFLATPNVENECWISYETLLVKWNWWWNFACLSTKSLDFEIYFLSFPWEIIFRCYFRQLFMYLALQNCKNDCKIFKITPVQIFVH